MNPQPPVIPAQPDLVARLKRLAPLAALLVFILLILGVRGIVNARHFRVVSTNPNVNNVAAITPFFKVTFNKTITTTGLDVSVNPDALSSYYVQGNTLVVNFNNPMDIGKTYTVTIKTVVDAAGQRITNKKFSFIPKDVPYDQLPADQQQAVQKQEPEENDLRPVPTVDGTAALMQYGVSSNQVNSLVQALETFVPKAKIIDVQSASINSLPHDATSTNPVDGVTFTMTVDGAVYNVKLSYTDLSSVDVVITNAAGAQVYDSGTITS